MPSRTCSVRLRPVSVALQMLDHPQRVLVVAKALPEALFQAAVEHLLADVPERRVPEVVAEADRLDQVLVQAQRPGDRPRDRGDLERVGEPRAVVVAPRAPRTPASCASGGGTPCSGRSGRDRAGTACAARSPPRHAPCGPDRSARPAARAVFCSCSRQRSAKPAATVSFPLATLTVAQALAVPVARGHAVSLCAPVAPLGLRAGILVVHRRPAARARAGSARPRSRSADRPRVRAGWRSSAASTKRGPWRGRDHQAVEDVLLGRGHDVVNGAHLLAVAMRARERPFRAPRRRWADPRPRTPTIQRRDRGPGSAAQPAARRRRASGARAHGARAVAAIARSTCRRAASGASGASPSGRPSASAMKR